MSDRELLELRKKMSSIAGIQSNLHTRAGLEQTYFLEMKRRGARLRAKYRL